MRTQHLWLPALLAAAAATMLIAWSMTSPRVGAADATVQVGQGGNRFVANSVNIEPGDSVVFEHANGTHNVTFVAGFSFNEDIPSGGSATAGPFAVEGTFYYYCAIHASAGSATAQNVENSSAMVGRVIVGTELPSPTPTETATPTETPTPTNTPPEPSNTPTTSATPLTPTSSPTATSSPTVTSATPAGAPSPQSSKAFAPNVAKD